MTTKIGFVMDPIESINPKKDSTLAMMRAADKKGWKMFYMEQKDIFTRNGKAYGLVQELTLCENKQDWYQLSEKFKITLAELHVIMMRKDPPFDNEYIYSTTSYMIV